MDYVATMGTPEDFKQACSYIGGEGEDESQHGPWAQPSHGPGNGNHYSSTTQTITIADKVKAVKDDSKNNDGDDDDGEDQNGNEIPPVPIFEKFKDSRPVIYVNDPSFFFNITGNTEFTGVTFDGIN